MHQKKYNSGGKFEKLTKIVGPICISVSAKFVEKNNKNGRVCRWRRTLSVTFIPQQTVNLSKWLMRL